ncbi:MAG: S1 RNA-binding domain-containing protein [Oscillospiraceae bacterium]|nr:S1 RNA-binding domain-containing protein [Oscillospiraceae bacterium]
MDQTIGAVFSGRVTSITNFGAFVSFGENQSGLVHISEISDQYVNNVRDFLTEGQEVTIKVLGANNEGRFNLSICKASPHGERRVKTSPNQAKNRRGGPASPPTFEDKLKAFMSDSERKIGDLRKHDQRPNRRRK